jgi:hypothetical protein
VGNWTPNFVAYEATVSFNRKDQEWLSQLETCLDVKKQSHREPQAEIANGKAWTPQFFESLSESYRSGEVRN